MTLVWTQDAYCPAFQITVPGTEVQWTAVPKCAIPGCSRTHASRCSSDSSSPRTRSVACRAPWRRNDRLALPGTVAHPTCSPSPVRQNTIIRLALQINLQNEREQCRCGNGVGCLVTCTTNSAPIELEMNQSSTFHALETQRVCSSRNELNTVLLLHAATCTMTRNHVGVTPAMNQKCNCLK